MPESQTNPVSIWAVVRLTLCSLLYYVLICVAFALMLRLIIGYTSFDTHYAFLAQKQDYLDNKVWLAAFYTHVFTSLLTLAAAFTQFSPYILKHHRSLHRTAGRIYVGAVLLVNVPAGFIMAIYANGLWPSKLAFLILDMLWAVTTLLGWQTAKQRNFKKHRAWMIRSYALTFSAITLRTWRSVLEPVVSDPAALYMIDAWLGFVPNLIMAELWIRRSRLLRQKAIVQASAPETN